MKDASRLTMLVMLALSVSLLFMGGCRGKAGNEVSLIT